MTSTFLGEFYDTAGQPHAVYRIDRRVPAGNTSIPGVPAWTLENGTPVNMISDDEYEIPRAYPSESIHLYRTNPLA
jgi:hypothetical protein